MKNNLRLITPALASMPSYIAALKEGEDLDYLVAVMMVEASVNAAVEATSRDDVIRLLKDLTRQIEEDVED